MLRSEFSDFSFRAPTCSITTPDKLFIEEKVSSLLSVPVTLAQFLSSCRNYAALPKLVGDFLTGLTLLWAFLPLCDQELETAASEFLPASPATNSHESNVLLLRPVGLVIPMLVLGLREAMLAKFARGGDPITGSSADASCLPLAFSFCVAYFCTPPEIRLQNMLRRFA